MYKLFFIVILVLFSIYLLLNSCSKENMEQYNANAFPEYHSSIEDILKDGGELFNEKEVRVYDPVTKEYKVMNVPVNSTKAVYYNPDDYPYGNQIYIPSYKDSVLLSSKYQHFPKKRREEPKTEEPQESALERQNKRSELDELIQESNKDSRSNMKTIAKVEYNEDMANYFYKSYKEKEKEDQQQEHDVDHGRHVEQQRGASFSCGSCSLWNRSGC